MTILIAFFFHGFGTYLWFTLFPKYLVDLSIPGPYIGLIFTCYQATLGFTALPAGRVADAIGRRTPLLMGSSVTLASTFLFSFTTDFMVILFLMILFGLGYGLMIPAGLTYVADLQSKGGSGRAFGNFYATAQLGFVIGSFLSGFVKSSLSPSSVFLIASSFVLVSVIAFALLKEERRPTGLQSLEGAMTSSLTSAYLLLRSDKSMRLLTLALALHGFGFTMLTPFIAPLASYGAGLSEPEVGFVLGLWMAAITAGMAPFGRLVDRLGGNIVLFLHILLSTASWTLYSFSSGFIISSLNMVFFGVIGAMDFPARRSIMADHESKVAGKATVIGTVDSVVGLTALAAPTIGGYLWSAMGYKWPFLVASLVNITALLPMLILVRLARKGQTNP